MSGFTKLDSGIVHSTIWVQPHDVLRAWIALLALADMSGVARTAAPALAHLCMIPLDRMRDILRILESPDEDSRTESNEGRRIVKVEGGWRLVNYLAYRNARDEEIRREQNRESQQRFRAKQRQQASATVSTSKQDQQQSAQAEAEAEADKSKGKEQVRSRGSRLPTDWVLPADWKEEARAERPDLDLDMVARKFKDHWRGKAGKEGLKLDWKMTWRNWVRNERGGQVTNAKPADRHGGFQDRAYGEGGLL